MELKFCMVIDIVILKNNKIKYFAYFLFLRILEMIVDDFTDNVFFINEFNEFSAYGCTNGMHEMFNYIKIQFQTTLSYIIKL